MNVKDCRGEIRQAERLTHVDVNFLFEYMKEGTQINGIPAKVTLTSIHSGGLVFGKDYPCIMVSHPSPPQQYFDMLFIVNGDVITFQYWGNSKANYDMNKKAQLESEGKLIRASLVRTDPLALQTEKVWNDEILKVYDSGKS